MHAEGGCARVPARRTGAWLRETATDAAGCVTVCRPESHVQARIPGSSMHKDIWHARGGRMRTRAGPADWTRPDRRSTDAGGCATICRPNPVCRPDVRVQARIAGSSMRTHIWHAHGRGFARGPARKNQARPE